MRSNARQEIAAAPIDVVNEEASNQLPWDNELALGGGPVSAGESAGQEAEAAVNAARVRTIPNAKLQTIAAPARSTPPGTISPDSMIAPLAKTAEAVFGSKRQEGAIAALGRQFTMRNERVNSANAVRAVAPAPASATRTEATGEARQLAGLATIFGLSDSNSNNQISERDRPKERVAAPSKAPQDGATVSIPVGTLRRQWAPASDEGSRTRPATRGAAPIASQTFADQNVTIPVPRMMNPFTMSNATTASRSRSGYAIHMASQEVELPGPSAPNLDGGRPAENGAGQNDGNESKTLAEAERLGEEPEDTSLQFLRDSTVLLDPGESQFDIGITYLYAENSFPILLVNEGDIVGAEDVEFRIRELAVPLEYRFGVVKRVQAFIGASVGWSNTQVAIDSFEAFQNDGGFGDLDFGATAQLIDGNHEKPYMLATVSATAPTGGDPFGPTAALATSAPSLGQGFWSISGSLLCIRTYDPLVFYYGVGTEHFLGRDFNGHEIDPGASWNYRFGLGFAVNDRVTLSTRFQGAYVEEVKIDRERVFGSNTEPMSLRMAATISKECNRLVEPFVEFGLTEGAVSSYFGVTWTF